MAASNPGGEMQFWDNGFPFQGLKLGSNDAGEMQFWDNGFPMQFLFPAAAGGSLIKTLNGVTQASTKTRNGVAMASIKAINSINNV